MNPTLGAAHLPNLIFFLLVAVVLLFRWLASKAGETNADSPEVDPRSTSTPRDETIERAPGNSEEERIRKFLEALGQPAGSRPPPVRPVKRVTVPRQPPRDAGKKIHLPGQLTTPSYEQKTFKPITAEATVFEVQENARLPEPAPASTTPAVAYTAATAPKAAPRREESDLMALLKSPSGLRNAIILREVFGPPRGLQPLDLTGSA